MIKRQDIEHNDDRKRELENILWWMFRSPNGKQYPVKAVAPELNISPDALNKYIRGDLTFPAYLIAPLYNATKEKALVDYILSDCDDLAVIRKHTEHKPDGSFENEKDAFIELFAKLIKITNEAKADGIIDPVEIARMLSVREDMRKVLDDYIEEGKQYNERGTVKKPV